MSGVLNGFAILAIVIGVGMVLAHTRVVGANAQEILAKLVFHVASPCLMITVMGSADVHTLFSSNLIASVSGVAATALIHVLAARLIWKRSGTETVIGTFCTSYVNAGNLGLPIAAYVLGDGSVIAPMLLVQLVLLQPIGLAVIDVLQQRASAGDSETAAERARRRWRMVLGPITNPMLVGSLIGVVLALTGWQLPAVINDPVELIGGMAIPAMLIAYGIGLRLGPLPGRGENVRYLGLISLLKLIVQPLVAGLVGYHLLGLHDMALLGVCIIAALPTAQNVFTFALRYQTGIVLARDAIFINTLGSVPVIVGIVALVSQL
ncbi:MAG TPA: AEC family transporter [Candidatus Avipropionibacterium avicola]|uniref:AEC family transporter n=1 Tax=Candidatus Avipropionibacterium avicola TaxID=2840701 RepID=A0A9D1H164_9ACTN|nr:AEC family transporter [Candidatus Avipropionibacterium avicola]